MGYYKLRQLFIEDKNFYVIRIKKIALAENINININNF